MKSFSKIVSLFHNLCTLLLIAVIPIYFNVVTRWVLILFFFSFLLDYFVNRKYVKEKFWSWQKLPFICCVFLYILLVCYYFLEQDTFAWHTIIENRLPLLGLGIVGWMGFHPQLKVQHVASVFMIVSLLMIIAVIAHIGLPDWWEYHSPRYVFTQARKELFQAHMAFNIYLIGGVIGAFWVIFTHHNLTIRIASGILSLILYVTIVSSDGRVGLIGIHLIMLAVFIQLLLTVKSKTTQSIIISLSPIIVGIMFLFVVQSPKIEELIHSENDIRTQIWKESVAIGKKHPVLGCGASTCINEIIEAYPKNEIIKDETFLMEHVKKDNFLGAHPHNQLLQSWIEFGIMGAVLIILLYISPFFILFKQENYIVRLAFWVVILLQLQTETIHTSVTEIGFGMYLLLMMFFPATDKLPKKHHKKIPSGR